MSSSRRLPLHLRGLSRLFLATACAWAAFNLPAQAQSLDVDLCARAVGQDPVKPFAEMQRVKLSVQGPTLTPAEQSLLWPQLLQMKVWADRKVEVFAEPFDAEGCAAATGSVSLWVQLEEADVAALRAQAERGALDAALLRRIAGGAMLGVSASSMPGADAAAQRQWLKLFFATNRRATGQAATDQAFSGERADAVTRGTVEVSVQRQKAMKDLDRTPAVLRFDGVTDLQGFAAAGRFTVLERDAWEAELRRRAARFEKPGVLLFIHGYNVSFVDAARRAAQLSYDLAFPGPTVFFAWPSDASLTGYLKDGRDAENSWGAAAEVLAQLTGLDKGVPVYVVAHSMGNRVMLGGLSRLLDEHPERRRAVASVVMAAADVDQESFRLNWSRKLLNVGVPFTLYASDRDRALQSSELLQGGARLGSGGKALVDIPWLEAVDASSATQEMFGLNHSYFGDKSAVLSDLFYVVRARMPADKRPHLKRLGAAAGWQWRLE